MQKIIDGSNSELRLGYTDTFTQAHEAYPVVASLWNHAAHGIIAAQSLLCMTASTTSVVMAMSPTAIATDYQRLYVLDTTRKIVSSYTLTGGLVNTFGYDVLTDPTAVAASYGSIYVLDARSRVVKFSNAGEYQAEIFVSSANVYCDIEVGPDDVIYLVDNINNSVLRIPASGGSNTASSASGWSTVPTFTGARSVSRAGTGVVITSDAYVVLLDSALSAVLGVYAIPATHNYLDITMVNNALWYCLGTNSIIYKCIAGAEASSWGGVGTGSGVFTSARGLSSDSSGNIFVVDSGHSGIQKFSSTGTYITTIQPQLASTNATLGSNLVPAILPAIPLPSPDYACPYAGQQWKSLKVLRTTAFTITGVSSSYTASVTQQLPWSETSKVFLWPADAKVTIISTSAASGCLEGFVSGVEISSPTDSNYTTTLSITLRSKTSGGLLPIGSYQASLLVYMLHVI